MAGKRPRMQGSHKRKAVFTFRKSTLLECLGVHLLPSFMILLLQSLFDCEVGSIFVLDLDLDQHS